MFTTMGAGCLSTNKAKATTGGVWESTDAGKNWTAVNSLLQAGTNGSIGSVDVNDIAFDPQDNKAVYAATSQGVFYSLDGGKGWQRPAETAARTGSALQLAVDSKNVCTYYVLKADRLMKTTTCGRTFSTETYVETRSDARLTALALDWYNSNIVWLGTSEGDVLKSTDGGATWSASYRAKQDITSILINGGDSRIILVGTTGDGVLRTADSGATWQSLEEDLKSYKKSEKVYDFAQNTAGDTTVMSTQYGLFVSSDAGATWKALTLVTSKAEVEITAVAVDPKDGNIIMYGTDSTFYRTSSGGATWATEDLPTSRAAHVIAPDPSATGRILLGLKSLSK